MATGAATAAPVHWTPEAKQGFEQAQRAALALGHVEITPEHLLVGLLGTDDCTAARILDALHVPRERLRQTLMTALGARETSTEKEETLAGLFAAHPGLLATTLHRLALDLAHDSQRSVVDSGDLLLAIPRLPDGLAASALAQLGVNRSALRDALEQARQDADTDTPSE